jgi:hypothetical protein
VLFIGGGWPYLASVQIRCVDIATRLGCRYLLNVSRLDQIGELDFDIYVCVKTVRLSAADIRRLGRNAKVIWDIIDDSPPPYDHLARFLASTNRVAALHKSYGEVEVIPHHHCNFSGLPNDPQLRRAGWVGHAEWYPDLSHVEHDAYDARRMAREEIVACYRKIGIGLNLRARNARTENHLLYGAGVKLINCIGFGIPSVSSHEAAYEEIGPECTVFAGVNQAPAEIDRLCADEEWYQQLRARCLEKAGAFHIDAIAARYWRYFESL